jgi:hypothetical protein
LASAFRRGARQPVLAPAAERYDAVMEPENLTKERLAELLRDAEHAHADFERELGHRDDEWPAWYAGYIVDRLRTPE